MTIPMYKIERTTIKMNPDHGCRYKELAGALNERQRSDRSYLAACYLLSADEEIFDIAKQYVSIDGIDFAAIRMRVKSALAPTTSIPRSRLDTACLPGGIAR
ncbi:hypothetical protein NIA69_22800 [Gemmiger formicilis]|nr:hypothetical protein [Gemmiger formicilis]